MVSSRTAKITVNTGTNENYTVGIYKNDPLFNASNCGLLAKGTVSDGNSVNLTFDSPTAQNKYYIGLFDSKGRSVAQLDSLNNNVLTATFGGTIARSAKSRTRVSANEQSTSTAYNAYLKTEVDFNIPTFSNSYTDITTIPESYYTKMDDTNSSGNPIYGDGKHYYIPSGKTIKADINFTKQKDNNCVIYIQGTWELPNTRSFTNGEQIIVANGGKIIFDGDANFNSGARFINQGTVETSTGTIYIENYSETNADCYNSGIMTLNNGGLSVAGNNSQLYNSGTMTMNYLDARGNCLFTNYGSLTAKTTTKNQTALSDQGTAASNFRLINGCHTSIDAMGVTQLIVLDNSRVDCSTGIYTGGGNSNNYVCLGNKSEICAGDWIDNGGHIYGSISSNEYSIFKHTGSVSESSSSAFKTKGYVYFDGTFSTEYHVNAIKTGDADQWNKNVCPDHIQYTSNEDSSLLTIPAGDCTGTGYNTSNSGGNIPATPSVYTIAFEDLGSIGDYDFNDIVLYVYPDKSANTLKVNLVAAGGILPVDVYYNDTEIFSHNNGSMENTTSDNNDKTKVISTYTTGISSDFTLSDNNFINKFKIVVHNTNGTETSVAASTEIGKAPQALLLPTNWTWPKETVNIGTTYSKFKNWISDKTKDINWYEE